VQPFIRREDQGDTAKVNFYLHEIPDSFGDESQSGALLRFTVDPDGLVYRHPAELTEFVETYLMGKESQRTFVRNFLAARQNQLESWKEIGRRFLGYKPTFEEMQEEREVKGKKMQEKMFIDYVRKVGREEGKKRKRFSTAELQEMKNNLPDLAQVRLDDILTSLSRNGRMLAMGNRQHELYYMSSTEEEELPTTEEDEVSLVEGKGEEEEKEVTREKEAEEEEDKEEEEEVEEEKEVTLREKEAEEEEDEEEEEEYCGVCVSCCGEEEEKEGKKEKAEE